jgi:hypothetical protein
VASLDWFLCFVLSPLLPLCIWHHCPTVRTCHVLILFASECQC